MSGLVALETLSGEFSFFLAIFLAVGVRDVSIQLHLNISVSISSVLFSELVCPQLVPSFLHNIVQPVGFQFQMSLDHFVKSVGFLWHIHHRILDFWFEDLIVP